MFTIQIENLSAVQRAIDAHGKHARFAAAKSLTEVAESARQAAVRRMKTALHAPTDYTLNSLFKKPATREKLEAMVYVKDSALLQKSGARGPDRVIGHLFGGGAREDKNFERALRRIGILPAGMAAVPGSGVALDSNGNMPRALITRLLAYFGAFSEQGYSANMTAKSRAAFERRLSKAAGADVQFFVSRGSGRWFGRGAWKNGHLQHLPPGIWMRIGAGLGGRVRPIVMFVKTPKYRQYIDLMSIAQDTVSVEFERRFTYNLQQALATAR